MMSRRSFVMHMLATAALVPLLGAGQADARQKTRRKHAKNRPAKNRPRYASLRRRQARHARKPVARRAVVRAPRNRLEEGWPYGWMDPHWYRSSGDPFFDPGRWN